MIAGDGMKDCSVTTKNVLELKLLGDRHKYYTDMKNYDMILSYQTQH